PFTKNKAFPRQTGGAIKPCVALSGFLIESGLQGMHSALKVSARAEVFDELRYSAHAGGGGDLQPAVVSETSDHAVVLIFVQQGFKHGTGLRAVLGEHIALAHIGHAVTAGERWLVEGDVADEVEGVHIFTDFFK